MNQQTVVIKSNKYGITLFLDKDTEFSELLKDIGEKFKESSKFFKDAQMAIAFEGRILSQEEQMDVIRVIQESSGLEILCILEQDALKEAYMKGDTLAREIFFQITEIVGTLLYNISTILDIDRFVIGGGFINFGDDLFVGLKNAFMKYSKIPADIVCAELKQDFGIIGAAQLLFE